MWLEQIPYQMQGDFGTPYLKRRYGLEVLNTAFKSGLLLTGQGNNLAAFSKIAEFWDD